MDSNFFKNKHYALYYNKANLLRPACSSVPGVWDTIGTFLQEKRVKEKSLTLNI